MSTQTRTQARRARIRITTQVADAESCYSRRLAQDLSGIASDARRTNRLFHRLDAYRRFGKRVKRLYREGRLERHVRIEDDREGRPVALLESQGIRMEARLLRQGSSGTTEKWSGVAEVVLSDGEYDAGQVHVAATALITLGAAPILAALLDQVIRAVLAFAIRLSARFVAYLTAPESVSGYHAAVGAAEEAAAAEEGEVALAEGEAAATAEATCATAIGLGVGLAVVAIGLIVEFLLSNVMHHQLRIYNSTSKPLNWEIAYIDTGQIFRFPPARSNRHGHPGTQGSLPSVDRRTVIYQGQKLKSDRKVGSYGDFSIVTDSFAEGVGYMIKISTGRGHSPVYAKIVIPYWGSNRLAIIPARRGQDLEDLFDDDRWDVEGTHIVRSKDLGGLTMRLTIDKLEGEQRNPLNLSQSGYYYSSVLLLEEAGAWS